MCIEANTMTLAFEKRKSFILRSTGKQTGGKALISVSLIWALVNLLWVWENGLVRKSTSGASFLWRALNLAIYGKVWNGGFQPWIFLDNETLFSERVLTFWFQPCSSFLGSTRRKYRFWVLRRAFLLCTCPGNKTCSLTSAVSARQLDILLSTE